MSPLAAAAAISIGKSNGILIMNPIALVVVRDTLAGRESRELGGRVERVIEGSQLLSLPLSLSLLLSRCAGRMRELERELTEKTRVRTRQGSKWQRGQYEGAKWETSDWEHEGAGSKK